MPFFRPINISLLILKTACDLLFGKFCSFHSIKTTSCVQFIIFIYMEYVFTFMINDLRVCVLANECNPIVALCVSYNVNCVDGPIHSKYIVSSILSFAIKRQSLLEHLFIISSSLISTT